MNASVKTACGGYGAFELKSTYQRNMILGTLITALLTTCIILGLYVYQALTPALIEIPGRPLSDGGVVIDRIAPPSIRPPETSIDIEGKIEQLREQIGIPIPVHDNGESNDGMIISGDDLKRYNDYIIEETKIADVGDDTILIIEDRPDYPEMNEFVSVSSQPVMIYEEPLDYPSLAKKIGWEGELWVKALVDKDGNVVEAVIYKASGTNVGFEEAAVAAALKCKYKPAIKDGHPIAVWVSYKVEFRLRLPN